jgi:Domain of unknown function (DUF4145)
VRCAGFRIKRVPIVNRHLWTATLRKHHCPPWPCPVCTVGTVRLVKDSLNERETAESKKDRKFIDDWDPDWLSYVFTANGVCSNENCSQDFAISGTGGVEPGYDEDGQTWEEFFSPKACFPMPHIITIPPKCPTDVEEDLVEAFSLFWAHRGASANAIRYALEKLLTSQGVPTQTGGKKDPAKFVLLPLHQRIDLFSKSEPEIGNHLMALKWLGNTGSHGRKVDRDDLLDAFEILEHSLEEIIEKKSKRVAKLAKSLTKKHS